MRAKLSGDFTDIQVWNRIRPDHISVVFLVVFGHGLAGMACNGLAIFTGSFVQVQRQRAHFVKARHFLFFPVCVTTRQVPSIFEGLSQVAIFNFRPVLCIRPAKSSSPHNKAKTWCALKFKWTPVLAF